MKGKIKVHVADDHLILIEGIIAMLHTDKNIKVVGHSLTGKQVIEWFKTNEADVLVLDINMPGLDGIEVLKKFNKKKKYQKIIMLSSYDDPKLVKELTDYGANGFISKTSAGDHIIKAIYAVHQGIPYYSDDIKEGLVNIMTGEKVAKGTVPDQKIIDSLTDREMDILVLVAKEYSTQEIADELRLSIHTISEYRKKLFNKINVKNVVGLAMFVVRNKII